MKKTLTILAATLLALLICVTCVACNDNSNPSDGQGEKPNDYEVATYTVTFDTGEKSNYTFEGSVLKDVPAGSKISAPRNANGELIIPTQKGYTFAYWMDEDRKEFDFNTRTINKDTKLTAYYVNNVFTHEVVLDATYEFNADGTCTVKEGTYEAQTGYKMSLGADVKVQSTYDEKSELAYPAARNTNDEEDLFYCWFYIDEDGKPVQFTDILAKRTSDTVSSVKKYTLTYNDVGVPVLYPLFRSMLPKIEVQFLAKDGSVLASKYYRYDDEINESEKYDAPDIAGYKFSNWYYEIVTDDEVVKYDFNYKTSSQSGTEISALANPQLTCLDSKSVQLKSKWIKQIGISSKSQFDALYNLLHKENPTDDEKAEIAEVLEADIKISGTIELSGEYKPLFDEKHIFVGTIDGGTRTSDGKVSKCATIKGGNFADVKHASVLGYVDGVVQNLVFENVTLSIVKDGDKYADEVYMGVVASVNNGKIDNVSVVNPTVETQGLGRVIVGGVAAVNRRVVDDTDKGYISNCTVGSELQPLTLGAKCTLIQLGGIVGDNKSKSYVVSCNAFVTVKDGEYSSARIGGLVGNNAGYIQKSQATTVVGNVVTDNEMSFGGAAAVNSFAVEEVHTVCSFGSVDNYIAVGGALSQIVNVGGIVGKNDGYVRNAYTDANLFVKLTKSSVIAAVGGVVGNNFGATTQVGSGVTSPGAINYCYSTGNVNVVINSDVNNAKLYVAGIVGRNAKKNIGSCFTLADISVSNVTADGTANANNTVWLGFGFGSMENSAVVTKCWYLASNKLSLNGENYSVSVVEGEDVENFEITKTGGLKTPDESVNAPFESQSWLAANTDFNFDKVWNLDGGLPVLKDLA